MQKDALAMNLLQNIMKYPGIHDALNEYAHRGHNRLSEGSRERKGLEEAVGAPRGYYGRKAL